MRFLLNFIVWPSILLGLLWAYIAMGFNAGRLMAADMFKDDIKQPSDEVTK